MSLQEHFYCDYSIGENAYAHVDAVCRPYGSRVLLLGGKKALAAGEAKLKQALQSSSVQIVRTEWFGKDCTSARIEELAALAKELDIDMVFGMGGGRALDTSKGVAFHLGIPVFTFPTIAATCAATTALSVIYHEDGEVEECRRYPRPAFHTFIDTAIIAKAPWIYLQAGIGDTMAKFFECQFSSRGEILPFSLAMGRTISSMCYEPQLHNAVKGLNDCKTGINSPEVEEVVLANIVATGLVSSHVTADYNCALAHPIYYGLEVYPGFAENNLHGNAVAYGILVELAVDQEFEQARQLKSFLQQLGIRTTLREMNVKLDREALKEVLRIASTSHDLDHVPYKITLDMIYEAMEKVEAL